MVAASSNAHPQDLDSVMEAQDAQILKQLASHVIHMLSDPVFSA